MHKQNEAVMSSRELLSCGGFTLETVVVPSFNLRAGDTCRLQLPREVSAADRTLLEEIFTGRTSQGKVQYFGRPTTIPRTSASSDRTVGAFMSRMNLTTAQTDAVFERLKTEDNALVGRMSGTARMLLQVEVSLQLSEIVVFDMALDPLGLEKIRSYLRLRGANHGIIELLGPMSNLRDMYAGDDLLRIEPLACLTS